MVLWTVDQGWNSIIMLNTINNRSPSWEILFYSIRSRNLFPGLHLFSCHLLLGNFFNFNFIFSSWHHLLAFCQDHLYVTWWTHVCCNQQGKQHIKLPHCCTYSLRSWRILVAGVLSGSQATTPKERRSHKGKFHLPHFLWVWMPPRFQIGLYPLFSRLHYQNNTRLPHYSNPASYAGYSTQVICGASTVTTDYAGLGINLHSD